MNNFHPLISIVILVHNGANHMREAINSVLAQTYDNYELLLINAGSCDNGETERIAKSYEDKIRYIAQKDSDMATALNLGIKEARGEYFSWLSQNDRYLPEKIESQVAFMKQFELTDAAIFANHVYIDCTGKRTEENVFFDVPPENVFLELYKRPFFCSSALIIPRRAVLAVDGFSEHFKTAYSYEFLLKICRNIHFVQQNVVLVESIRHSLQGSAAVFEQSNEIRDLHRCNLPYALQDAAKKYKENLIVYLTRLTKYRLKHGDFASVKDILVLVLNDGNIRRQIINSFWSKLWKDNKIALTTAKDKESNTTDRFAKIYQNNFWGSIESASGSGSTLLITRSLRHSISSLLQELHVEIFLDAPCGDYNWMQHVDMHKVQYIGCDIVPRIIDANTARFSNSSRSFICANIIKDPLPKSDIVLCRDCLVHLSFDDAFTALRNIKKSGAKWLLTTTFIERTVNKELGVAGWRVLNLQLAPFNFPTPAKLIIEKCFEGGGIFADKSLGLWEIDSLKL